MSVNLEDTIHNIFGKHGSNFLHHLNTMPIKDFSHIKV